MEMKDLNVEKYGELREAVKETLELPEDPNEGVKVINEWLCAGEIPDGEELSKNELRGYKKAWITALCKDAFTESWNAKIANDCDDVFADTMLADTYSRSPSPMRSIIALKLLPPPEAMTPILNMGPNIAICGQFQVGCGDNR